MLVLALSLLVALAIGTAPTEAAASSSSSSSANGPPEYGFWKHVPRWDFSFHSVSTRFDPESRAYQESLYWWFIIACVIGGGFFLTGILFWTCRCCFPTSCGGTLPQESFCCNSQKRTRPYTDKSKVCCALTLCFLLICIAACLVIAFLGNVRLNDAVNAFRKEYRNSNTKTVGSIESVISQFKTLEGVADNDADFATARKSATSITHTWNSADNVIKEWNHYRYIAAWVILGLLSGFSLMSLIALLARKGWLFKALAFSGFALVLLAWVLCGAHFSGGMLVSDYCRDTYSFSQSNPKNSQVPADTSSPIFRLLDCPKSFQGMASLVSRLEAGQATKLSELNGHLQTLNPPKSTDLDAYTSILSDIQTENLFMTSSQKLNIERLVAELSLYADAIATGTALRSCTQTKSSMSFAEEESCPSAILATNFLWTSSLTMGILFLMSTVFLVVLAKRFGFSSFDFQDDKLTFTLSRLHLPTSGSQKLDEKKPLNPAMSDVESGSASRPPVAPGHNPSGRTTPTLGGGRTTPTGPGGRASPTVRNGKSRAEVRKSSSGSFSHVVGGRSPGSLPSGSPSPGSPSPGSSSRIRTPKDTYARRAPH